MFILLCLGNFLLLINITFLHHSFQLHIYSYQLSHPLFHPLSPLSMVSTKKWNLIKSQYEMLKLSILCTRFESNYSSCTVKIYVPVVWRRLEKWKDGTKVSLPPKFVEKLVWVPVISFCKISFPVTHLMPILCPNWPFSPLKYADFMDNFIRVYKDFNSQ